ncbi:hypothetical protein MJM95_27375, partial [Salmonella enterica subsp. enterica serovar Anatum]|nr:hypothetical protein [Salmonella enterica subsp. enterica serovar Anatum]
IRRSLQPPSGKMPGWRLFPGQRAWEQHVILQADVLHQIINHLPGQGVEAQTLANCYTAMEMDLEVVPVLNKIDLPAADPERVAE